MAAADVVVSKPGYGIIAECAANGPHGARSATRRCAGRFASTTSSCVSCPAMSGRRSCRRTTCARVDGIQPSRRPWRSHVPTGRAPTGRQSPRRSSAAGWRPLPGKHPGGRQIPEHERGRRRARHPVGQQTPEGHPGGKPVGVDILKGRKCPAGSERRLDAVEDAAGRRLGQAGKGQGSEMMRSAGRKPRAARAPGTASAEAQTHSTCGQRRWMIAVKPGSISTASRRPCGPSRPRIARVKDPVPGPSSTIRSSLGRMPCTM